MNAQDEKMLAVLSLSAESLNQYSMDRCGSLSHMAERLDAARAHFAALIAERDGLRAELARVRDNLRCHLLLAKCDEEFIRAQTHGAALTPKESNRG